MMILVVFGVTLTVFLLVIAGMAVGVIMGRRAISGSCGGLANGAAGEESSACSLCSNPSAECKDLKSNVENRHGQDVEKSLAHSQRAADVGPDVSD